MRRTFAVAAAAASVAGGAAALIVASGSGAPGAEQAQRDQPNPVIDTNACPAIPGRVDVGMNFNGRPVERVRQCEPPYQDATLPAAARPPGHGVNAQMSVYGTCVPEPDAGCAPPLQIQTWDACERNYEQYAEYPSPDGQVRAHERVKVRGVDGAVFEDGHRVEMYADEVTVVIFADDPELAMQAARNVRGTIAGKVIDSNDPLPRGRTERC